MSKIIDKNEILSTCWLFRGLGSLEINLAAENSHYKKYAQSEIVHRAGIVPQKIMIPISGSLEISASTNSEIMNVDTLKLGVAATLLSMPIGYDCVVSKTTDFECLQMSRTTFIVLFTEFPALLTNFISELRSSEVSYVRGGELR